MTPSFSHGPGLTHDPHVGYRFAPDVDMDVPLAGRQYRLKTNAAGLRSSRDYSPRVPPGTRRILLLGDSFTAGDGVDNPERFSDRIEAACPGTEVVNCDLPGSGTDQQLLLLEQLASHLEYDVLLVCPLVENIRRNVARFRPALQAPTVDPVVLPKPYFTLEAGALVLHNVPVPGEPVLLSQLPESERAFVDFGGEQRSTRLRQLVNRYAQPLKPWLIRATRFQPHPEYDEPASPAWTLMRAILERMVERNLGKPTVIAPLPYYIHIEHPRTANYMPRFRELAGGQTGVVDLLPHFLRLSGNDRGRCRLGADPHYSPLAHSVVADALVAEMRRLDPLGAQSQVPSERQSRGGAHTRILPTALER